MTTWNELITLCLRDSGVVGMGQTASGQMALDAKQRLNMMLDEWRADDLLIYQVLDLPHICSGAQTYSVGPGQDFDVSVRPDAIEAAYLRQVVPVGPAQVDFPLLILNSPDDYARIALKTMRAAPSYALWYDTGYPVGLIHLYPLDSGPQWELHILIGKLLDKVVNLDDTIILPPRYERAIYTNLCVDLGTAFRRDPKPMMLRRAGASLKAIRRKNARIPLLIMPVGLTQGPAYNPYSDRGG